MGDPRKSSKSYDTPKRPWDKTRLGQEKELMGAYGLTNKKELWKMKTVLRKKRHNARHLLALPLEERTSKEQELVQSLNALGVLSESAHLDDVLGLELNSVMERRLETQVVRKNLAKTMKQSRQFIVHGHIAVNGRKVTAPSYLLKRGEEEKLSYFKRPLIIEQALELKPIEELNETEENKMIKKENEKSEAEQ